MLPSDLQFKYSNQGAELKLFPHITMLCAVNNKAAYISKGKQTKKNLFIAYRILGSNQLIVDGEGLQVSTGDVMVLAPNQEFSLADDSMSMVKSLFICISPEYFYEETPMSRGEGIYR